MSEPLEIDDEQELSFTRSRFPGISEIIACIAGGAPFFLSFTSDSSVTTTLTGPDGTVLATNDVGHHFDFIAVPGGAIVIVAALFGLGMISRTVDRQKKARLVLNLALVALGAFHLLRGIGVLRF
jgi:hypothetical protein